MGKLAIHGGKPSLEKFIPYGRQSIDEDDIQAVVDVLKGDYLTTGPKVSELEKKLCDLTGAKYAVVLSNGTSALHTACHAVGITTGDEVITTPMTFAASANSVLYCGGKPVFADIDQETWNIDPIEIEKKITDKTKAVIAVDFTGQAVQLDEIKEICKKHKLILIEDAAHSIGTKYKGVHVGNIADLTTFSFHPVKTITCGEGGAILTNNEEFYKKMQLFRSHSITRDIDLLSQNPFNGYNEQIDIGYNYRMTDFQAALGLSQLKKLELFSKRRCEIVKQYDDSFSKLPQLIIQKNISESETTRHLYIIRIKPELLKVDRNELYKAINAEKVGLQVHYLPVYYHPYYRSLGYNKGLCPVAEKLYEEIITIPLFPAMTNYEVDGVIDAVTRVISYYKN